MVHRLAAGPGMVSTKILPIVCLTVQCCKECLDNDHHPLITIIIMTDTCLSSKLSLWPGVTGVAVCRAKFPAPAPHPDGLGHVAFLGDAHDALDAPPPSHAPQPLSSFDSGSASASDGGTCGTFLHATSVTL